MGACWLDKPVFHIPHLPACLVVANSSLAAKLGLMGCGCGSRPEGMLCSAGTRVGCYANGFKTTTTQWLSGTQTGLVDAPSGGAVLQLVQYRSVVSMKVL